MKIISFFLCCTLLSAQDNAYFNQLYTSINNNIENGQWENNFDLINEVTTQEAFRKLDCYLKGKIFHKIGVSYYLDNQEDEAIRYFTDFALSTWSNCPQVPAEERANTIFNIGISYQYLNQPEKAKKHLNQALVIFENTADYPLEALAEKYHGVGNYYQEIYDFFRAKLYFESALNIYRELPGTALTRLDILNNLILIQTDLKDYQGANDYFAMALNLINNNRAAFSNEDLFFIYQNAGRADFNAKNLDRAKEKSKVVLSLINKDKDSHYYTLALELAASIHLEENNFKLAEKLFLEVLSIRTAHYHNNDIDPGIYSYLALAYQNLCELRLKQKKFDLATKYLDKGFVQILGSDQYSKDSIGLPIIAHSFANDQFQFIELMEWKAKIFEGLHQQTGAPNHLKDALLAHHKMDSLINRSLLLYQFKRSRLDLLQLMYKHYNSAVTIAFQLYQLTKAIHYLETAFHFSSKIKAIILQYELNDLEALQNVSSTQLLSQEQTIRRTLNELQQELFSQNEAKDVILRRVVQNQRALDSIIQKIERLEPDYYLKKYQFIRPLSIEEVQKKLPNDFVVLEFFYGTDSLFSFWITKDSFFTQSIVIDSTFSKTIVSFNQACQDPRNKSYQSAGFSLYQKILHEGLNSLDPGINRICILPDGPLHRLPFEALSVSMEAQRHHLIEDYIISFAYSTGLLFREQQSGYTRDYVGFGTRYSDSLNQRLKENRQLDQKEYLSQLGLASEEIRRGASIFSGRSFLERDASLKNFYEHSGSSNILHLSLHGLVDFDNPGGSSILFDDHQNDFVLTARDLYAHQIQSDLVVLSVCHSANGRVYSGEGIQGMNKAFLLSGANSILSSLWSAAESSSLLVMVQFLERLKSGEQKDIALHQAKLDYLEKVAPHQRHPAYWANFTLVGELSEYEDFTATNNKWYWILSGAIGLGLLLIIFRFRGQSISA